MHEGFSPEQAHSPERAAVTAEIKKGLEMIETARASWIDAATALEEKIPHDDVHEDSKTYSFHVLRNTWLAQIDELDRLETELHQLTEDSKTAN